MRIAAERYHSCPTIPACVLTSGILLLVFFATVGLTFFAAGMFGQWNGHVMGFWISLLAVVFNICQLYSGGVAGHRHDRTFLPTMAASCVLSFGILLACVATIPTVREEQADGYLGLWLTLQGLKKVPDFNMVAALVWSSSTAMFTFAAWLAGYEGVYPRAARFLRGCWLVLKACWTWCRKACQFWRLSWAMYAPRGRALRAAFSACNTQAKAIAWAMYRNGGTYRSTDAAWLDPARGQPLEVRVRVAFYLMVYREHYVRQLAIRYPNWRAARIVGAFDADNYQLLMAPEC